MSAEPTRRRVRQFLFPGNSPSNGYFPFLDSSCFFCKLKGWAWGLETLLCFCEPVILG